MVLPVELWGHDSTVPRRRGTLLEEVGTELPSSLDLEGDGGIGIEVPIECVLVVDDRDDKRNNKAAGTRKGHLASTVLGMLPEGA